MAGIDRFGSRLRVFLRDAGGNFATLSALTFPLLLIVAAFAVDEAALYLEKRTLQAAVDQAAIAAAANPANARAIAGDVLARAGITPPGVPVAALTGIDPGLLVVETGRYAGDESLAPALRFAAGAQPENAVRVAYHQTGRLHFAGAFMADPVIGAAAIAHAEAMAAFSLGSRLASLNDGLANDILRGLLGTSLSLSVLDHRALLDLDIDLLRTLDLLATRLDLTAATYDEILALSLPLPDLAGALLGAALPGDPGAAVLTTLAPTLDRGISVRLADIIDLGPVGGERVGGAEDRATLLVSAMDMLTLGALLADGGRQLALDIGARVPGLLSASVNLAVGEPMRDTGYLTLGPANDTLETAQLRLLVTVHFRVNPGGALGILDVRLPLILELAPARARLVSVRCPPGGRAGIDVQPGLLRLAIGRPASPMVPDGGLTAGPATIIDVLGLVRATAHTDTVSHQSHPVRLDFVEADIAAGTIRTARTTTPLQSLLASLLRSTALEITVLNIPLLGPVLALGLKDLLALTLVGLAPALDTLLVGVLSALGISVGEADVRLNGLMCSRAVLVQ